MGLAQQHGSESWDTVQACLEVVLPLPPAEASICRGTVRDVPYANLGGQSNGCSPTAKVSTEAIKVCHEKSSSSYDQSVKS